MKTHKKIKYQYFRQGEGLWLPQVSNYEYCISSVRRYNNCLFLLAKLPESAIFLILYLSEIMDPEKNLIRSNEDIRSEFIAFMKKNAGVNYTHSTIKKAFHLLSKTGFLIKRKSSEHYLVNPLYFFRGEYESKREELIKSLIDIAVTPNRKIPDVIKKLKINPH